MGDHHLRQEPLSPCSLASIFAAAGGVCSQLLGVPTVQYLPYMWLAFLVPVFSLLYGFTGFAVWRAEPEAAEVRAAVAAT